MSDRLRPRARHRADHGTGRARQEAREKARRGSGQNAGATAQGLRAVASWRAMSETDKTPPPRRTIAVTFAGVLLLMLPAAAFAFMAAIFLVDRLGNRRV